MWMMLLGVAAAFAIAMVRRHFLVITVVGASMTPSLHDGQRLLARRRRRAHRSDVVAFVPPERHRHTAELVHRVKRVAAVAGDPVPPWLAASLALAPGARVPEGKLVVLGDNPDSEDSRHYGYVDEAAVTGVVSRVPRQHQLPGAR